MRSIYGRHIPQQSMQPMDIHRPLR
jgi:hypothetical protein